MVLVQPRSRRVGTSIRPLGRFVQDAVGALLADMPVRPVSLRFQDPVLEQQFRHEHFTSYLPVLRLALVLGFLLYPSFIVIDRFVVPDAMSEAFVIRFGLVGPLLLFTLIFSFNARFEAVHQLLFCVIAGTAGLGICALMALSPPPGNHIYSVGLIIVVIFGFHFMRLRFLYATALAWLFFAVFLAQFLLLRETDPAIVIGSISLLATTNLVEMAAGYAQELHVRRDFLHRVRLAEGERRLQSIAANIPGSVFRCIRYPDGAYTLRYMSEGLRHVFNRSPDVLMADPDLWDTWIHPDDLEGWVQAFRRAAEGTNPFDHELRFIGDDGEIKWMRTTGRPHRRANGEVVWDGINLDITDLKAREAELQQAQKMEALGQLTGGVAHDFNNLLTVISGNLQLFSEDCPPESEASDMIAEAQRAVDQGKALTGQLLTFARRHSLSPVATDIAALLSGMTELLRRTLGARIDVKTKTASELPPGLVDPVHLQNAILNLALNAKDAMDGVGTLTLEAASTVLDEAYCETLADAVPGEYIMLSVSDTGCGMSQEVLQHVFEPFFSTKEAGSGTGLGLSMVYGFVRQSQGHIHIYSEPGSGTTVRIYLPLATGLGMIESDDLPAVMPGHGETILLVEDNDGVRKLAERMLTGLGYCVRVASNASDALGMLDGDIDLLFTDMTMPGGMNGAELAAEAHRDYPNLPVLFATGYTEHSPVYEKYLSDGAILLSKPYRKDDVARAIRDTLSEGG